MAAVCISEVYARFQGTVGMLSGIQICIDNQLFSIGRKFNTCETEKAVSYRDRLRSWFQSLNKEMIKAHICVNTHLILEHQAVCYFSFAISDIIVEVCSDLIE